MLRMALSRINSYSRPMTPWLRPAGPEPSNPFAQQLRCSFSSERRRLVCLPGQALERRRGAAHLSGRFLLRCCGVSAGACKFVAPGSCSSQLLGVNSYQTRRLRLGQLVQHACGSPFGPIPSALARRSHGITHPRHPPVLSPPRVKAALPSRRSRWARKREGRPPDEPAHRHRRSAPRRGERQDHASPCSGRAVSARPRS